MSQFDIATFVPLVLGIILLVAGRRAFWLFIGAVAFMTVMTVVPHYLHHRDSLVFFVALGVGAVAAVAGVFLQKVAVRLAGFLAGGFLLFNMWEKFAAADSLPWWLPFIIGGILGAIMLSFLVEWALIILSSLTGAYLITESFGLGWQLHMGILVVLAIFGVFVQARSKRGKKRAKDE